MAKWASENTGVLTESRVQALEAGKQDKGARGEYDHHGIRAHRALTDNGAELCGRQGRHPYELFLHLNGIEHTRTKVRHPQANGAMERLHQTI